MKQNFYLLLLSLFLLLVGSFSFVQTPYFKEKLKEILNEQTSLDLEIGKLEGVFPFWMQAEDLSLTLSSGQISIQKLSFSLSPLTLLRKHLTFPHLHLEGVTISSTTSDEFPWPELPFALEIYSLRIEHFIYNSFPSLNIIGSLDCAPRRGNFSFLADITDESSPPFSLHLRADGDGETRNLALITHLQKERQNLWIGGNYSLSEKKFMGKIEGQGSLLEEEKRWEIHSPLMIDSNLKLSATPLTIIDQCKVEGIFESSLTTGDFLYSSQWATSPLLARGTFTYSLTDSLAQLLLQIEYLDNHLESSFSYHPTTKEFTGDLNFKSSHIETISPTAGGMVKAKLTFSQQHLSCLAHFSHFHWGELYLDDGHIDSKGERGKPLAFTLNITDFHVLRPTFEVFPILHLQAEGTMTDALFKMEGKIKGLCKENFTFNCKLPTLCSFKPLSFAIDPTKPFSIKCEGKGSIDPLLSFLENASLIAQGELNANLEISGLWGASEISGYLIFNKGRIQDLSTGALFQDLSLTFKGVGEKLLLETLNARDAHQGRIRGYGEIGWKEHFPFKIDLQAERFLLFALDPFTAHTDANITLSGTSQDLLIGGDATLLRGLITIPNKLPVKVPTLEVTYRNPLPCAPLKKKSASSFPMKFTWDVAIHIPKNLEIEGRGFHSDWQGKLNIVGSGEERRFTGELNLLSGRFEFARHNFHLNKGIIVIEGRDPKECYLDVEGSVELGGCITFMNVKGTLDNTKMAFTSTPPMSTEQIFSRLLFDSDLNELTPFQACRLAKFLVTLSGTYAGPSTFDALKDSIGIDVFDITRCNIDEMDFTFQVGKYISQGTYVGINKSISGDFDSVEIQTRIYQDFFLQGNYGGSLNGLTPSGGKIILKWYRSY